MQKHRIIRFMVVGTVALLVSLVPLPNLCSDTASSDKQAPASTEAAAKPAAESQDPIAALKQQMALQKKQIEQMQKALAEQEKLLEQTLRAAKPAAATDQAANPAAATEPAAAPQSSNLGQVASTTPMIPKGLTKPENASAPLAPANLSARTAAPARDAAEESSPLQLHIGSATLAPVGFMDFTGVFRTHAAGGSIGTSFGSIPYGTTGYQENLTEFRLSMQNSRIGFRADADVKGAHVIGYMEADFLGNNGTNVAVSSNSNTLRSRLYWVDLRKGDWEVLAGQTWSLITPGRTGISPLPADVFYSQDMDVNYQAGLVWGRIPELRFVYHPVKQVAFAIALDSPDQYAGGSSGGPTITFPPALSSNYSSELDTSASSGGLGAPNVAPDIIAKLAFDPNKMFHFEIGGVERDFKVYNPATTTTPAATFSAEGGGGFLNLNFDIFKGFRVLTNNFVSDGGGRYIFGQVPDLIAKADGSLSLIHADSTVSGFEYTHRKTLIFAYYGGIYAGRNFTIVPISTTTGTPPVTTTKLTPFGYGYTGASSSQNRAIQEATFGFNQTIWKDAKYGALNVIGQYSYLVRDPWYVAAGQPANANLNMLFFDLRYTLPGSAPTLGK
jgi:uncharacterized coiled-coil protein SlyX